MGVLIALLVALAPLAPSRSAAAEEQPLPVEKTATLKQQGAVYTVEGRVLLERRVDLESQRAITLRGVGEGATLVVAGSFKAKAALGGRNRFENITLELAPECRELHLAHVTWSGGGGIRTATDAPTAAEVYCEYVDAGAGVRVALECSEGAIDLQTSSFAETVAIRGTVPEGKKRNLTKVELLTCKSVAEGGTVAVGGFNGGLRLSDLADVTIRNSLLGGLEVQLERIDVLDFDGNLVRTALTDFVAADYKGFRKTRVHNTDFAAGRVTIFAPAEGDKRQKLTFDHCWFRGFEDDEVILREVVRAGTQDPECGVLAAFARVAEAPIGLGGPVE